MLHVCLLGHKLLCFPCIAQWDGLLVVLHLLHCSGWKIIRRICMLYFISVFPKGSQFGRLGTQYQSPTLPNKMCSAKGGVCKTLPVVLCVGINWRGNQTALDREAWKGEKRKVEEVKGTQDQQQQQQLHKNKLDEFVHRINSSEETTCKAWCIH